MSEYQIPKLLRGYYNKNNFLIFIFRLCYNFPQKSNTKQENFYETQKRFYIH